MASNNTFEQGVQEYNNGNYSKALDSFELLLSQEPNNVDALHLVGVMYSKLGDNDKAIEFIEKAIESSPLTPEFHCNLGNVFTQVGEYEKAEMAFERAIALSPQNISAHLNLGIAYVVAGNYESAIDALHQALSQEPENFDAKKYLLECFIKTGDHASAGPLITELLEKFPLDAKLHLYRGILYQEQGDYIAAIKSFQQTIELDVTIPEVYNRIGVIYFQVDELDMAVDMFRMAIERSVNYRDAYCNLGNALFRKGDYESAHQLFKQALDFNPDCPEVLNNVGAVYQAEEKYDQAIEKYQQAQTLNPTYLPAYQNLADLYLSTGHIDDAIATYEDALSYMNESIDANIELGKIYLNLSQFDKARSYFEAAAKNDEYISSLLWQAKVSWIEGETDAALKLVEQGLKQAPEDIEAHILLSTLQLLKEDFEKGWESYAWRWSVMDYASSTFQSDLPKWQGEAITDKKLLIWLEDDLPKNILFLSLLSDATKIAKDVGLVCKSSYAELLMHSHPDVEFITQFHPKKHVYDLQCAIGDLPRYLRSSASKFGEASTYLYSDQQSCQSERQKYREDGYKGLLIGVCVGDYHADGIHHAQGPSLASWQRLMDNIDARYIEFAASEKECVLDNAAFHESGIIRANNILSTANKISALDLVITIDDAVAHLAGALGKEVYLIVPDNPDWCWHLNRDDSIWYPNLKIFRNEHDFDHVMQEIIASWAKSGR